MTPKQSAKDAFIETLPLAIAVFFYGISYGVLASQGVMSTFETMLVSFTVFSGSVQLITVSMLKAGSTMISIFILVLLLNLRNLLYGAILAEGLSTAGKFRWLLAMGVNDEAMVLGATRFKKYGPDPVFFAVVSLTFYIFWIVASITGILIGGSLNTEQFGLDMVFPFTFIALLVPSLRSWPGIITVIAGVMMVFFMETIWPGNGFTLIISGLISPLAGMTFMKFFPEMEGKR